MNDNDTEMTEPMSKEEMINFGEMFLEMNEDSKNSSTYKLIDAAVKFFKQEPCEMTVEEYRKRMIQAFHNADCDELIAICSLPTEKEFEHLEWLLKNHYKKEHCSDAISRQAAIEAVKKNSFRLTFAEEQDFEGHVLWSAKAVPSNAIEGALLELSPVTPQPKTGRWISGHKETGALGITYTEKTCSNCGWSHSLVIPKNYCPNCGIKMEIEE